MNQAELLPPTVPEELPITTCSITITAALLNTNCFMWIPQAEGYINIELDKVLFFSFYVLFFLTLQQHPQVGLALSRCRRCSSLVIVLQKKRFSFNLNQQIVEQWPWGMFLSPPWNTCPQGSIWNLNCVEMVFVINNQIFEPLKYLCPFCICTLCPHFWKYCTGHCFEDDDSKKGGDALRKRHTRPKARAEQKNRSLQFVDSYIEISEEKKTGNR